ncbi:MAG: GTP-dependent dephospho-CoA kinase family protein [archaeon]
MLKLNARLRKLLKKPLAKPKKEIPEEIRFENIISIGDIASYNLLRLDITPKIAVYDGKERRKKISNEILRRLRFKKYLRLKNPPGHINLEIFEKFRKALNEEKYIYVFGEEDLLTLPAILFAPEGWFVCYGQPGQGLVIIKATKNIKTKAYNIMRKMEGEHELGKN